jgi:hypothetical protein
MGYDPTAASGTGPFPSANHLALAAALGLGTHKPEEIEVRGLALEAARHPFRWEPATRNGSGTSPLRGAVPPSPSRPLGRAAGRWRL